MSTKNSQGDPIQRKGWICTKCQRSNSPDVESCPCSPGFTFKVYPPVFDIPCQHETNLPDRWPDDNLPTK